MADYDIKKISSIEQLAETSAGEVIEINGRTELVVDPVQIGLILRVDGREIFTGRKRDGYNELCWYNPDMQKDLEPILYKGFSKGIMGFIGLEEEFDRVGLNFGSKDSWNLMDSV